MAQNFRDHGNCSPAQKFQTFLLDDDLEHLFRLGSSYLVLGKEKLGDSILPFLADIKAFLFAGFFEEFMRDLEKDPHSVSGLSLRVFSGSVFQMLYDSQSVCNCFVGFFAFNIHNCSNTAVIMLKFGTVKSPGFSSRFFHPFHPFSPDLSLRYVTAAHTNPRNRGCAWLGRDLNSGCPWVPS